MQIIQIFEIFIAEIRRFFMKKSRLSLTQKFWIFWRIELSRVNLIKNRQAFESSCIIDIEYLIQYQYLKLSIQVELRTRNRISIVTFWQTIYKRSNNCRMTNAIDLTKSIKKSINKYIFSLRNFFSNSISYHLLFRINW